MAERLPLSDLGEIAMAYPLIKGIVLPAFNVKVKAGTLYFNDLQARSAAQTNRTAGAAPTAVLVAEGSKSFTCTERIRRKKVADESIPVLGSIETARNSAARGAIRSVAESLETAVADAVYGSTTNSAISYSSFLTDVEDAKYAVEMVDGPTALVIGSDAFRTVMGLTEVTAEFGRLNIGVSPADRFRPDVLASILGVDKVILGHKSFWGALGTSDYSGYAAVVKLPNPNSDLVEYVQTGRVVVYWPSDEESMEVKYYHSDDLRANVVDACAWADVAILNGEGIQVITGITAGS